MKPYREMSKEELASLKEQLEAVYKEYQGKNLSLNMARGKPCKAVSYTHLDVYQRQIYGLTKENRMDDQIRRFFQCVREELQMIDGIELFSGR